MRNGALAFVLMVWCVGGAGGQAPAAAGAHRSCSVAPGIAPSDADQALARNQFEEAARLYAAMPASNAATAGVVRSMLGQHKLDEALRLAQKESAARPDDALSMDVLGEVRYRRGEVVEAARAYDRALALDPCAGRVLYDISRYMMLDGRPASGQRALDDAHKLAPHDAMIQRAWEATQRTPVAPAVAIARLQQRAQSDAATEEQKAGIANAIKALEAREKGDCEMVTPVESAKVKMWATNSSNSSTRPPTSSGVDVQLNGKTRRFVLDTGASGMLLSKDAAKALGLTPEAEMKTGGIGDGGLAGTFVAHVDSVKIGGMEFHNCIVRVLEDNNMKWTDGLLGPDIFRSFLVTLDFPESEMRLSPLPARPDDSTSALSLDTDGDTDATGNLTIAQTRRDRYIAPEMKDWDKVFRSGHHLILPTTVGKAPVKLFIMDTGAGQNLISPEVAREVTSVDQDTNQKVKGVNGEVKHVFETGSLSIQFAHVRQQMPGGITAIDTSSVSRGSGVEISGFIGYPTLRELVVQIDYRDNLVHVVYKPHVEHF